MGSEMCIRDRSPHKCDCYTHLCPSRRRQGQRNAKDHGQYDGRTHRYGVRIAEKRTTIRCALAMSCNCAALRRSYPRSSKSRPNSNQASENDRGRHLPSFSCSGACSKVRPHPRIEARHGLVRHARRPPGPLPARDTVPAQGGRHGAIPNWRLPILDQESPSRNMGMSITSQKDVRNRT